MKIFNMKTLTVLMASTILFSCAKDGDDGQNGLGFDELTRYGDISLKLEGTRSDNSVFTDEPTFKFLSKTEFSDFNSHTVNVEEEDLVTHAFDIGRFLSAPGTSAFVFISFDVEDLGGEEQVIEGFNLEFFGYEVVGADNQFFTLDGGFGEEDAEVGEFELSNLAFNDDTNRLSFTFSLEVGDGHENNVTGHALTISGDVNVTVFEELEEEFLPFLSLSN